MRWSVRGIFWNFLADRNTTDAKILARAVVALHKDADRVGADFRFDFSGRRTDAALEFVADHSRPAADVAFFDSAGVCGINGVEGVLGFDVEAVDVVEPAVPSFCDDGERPPVAGGIGLAMSNTPLNDGVADDADAVRVGDHYGTFEKTGFFDPGRAGHFAVAIERPPSSKYGIHHGIYATGKNGRDAGSDRAIVDIALAFAGDERGVADGDPGNVGYGVERAGRAVKRNAQRARAGLGRRSFLSQDRRNCRERAKKNGESAKII